MFSTTQFAPSPPSIQINVTVPKTNIGQAEWPYNTAGARGIPLETQSDSPRFKRKKNIQNTTENAKRSREDPLCLLLTSSVRYHRSIPEKRKHCYSINIHKFRFHLVGNGITPCNIHLSVQRLMAAVCPSAPSGSAPFRSAHAAIIHSRTL